MHATYRILTQYFGWIQILAHGLFQTPFQAILILKPEEIQDFNTRALRLGLDQFILWKPWRPSHDQDTQEAELFIVSPNALGDPKTSELLLRAHLNGTSIVDYKTLLLEAQNQSNLEREGASQFLAMATRQKSILQSYLFLKRSFEPLLAVALMIALLPVFSATALLIWILDPGPIFYGQVRTGYRGQTFRLYKFRTMRANAEENGPQWARSHDDRITPLGYWLRLLHIDELPQLWNVIRGEMSLIGPRPERPEFYEKLAPEIPLFHLRTFIPPGITGWAQVCAGYASSVEESKRKLEFDLYYIQHQSPVLDFMILIKTILVSLPIEPSERQI